jgi:hypothetical protein
MAKDKNNLFDDSVDRTEFFKENYFKNLLIKYANFLLKIENVKIFLFKLIQIKKNQECRRLKVLQRNNNLFELFKIKSPTICFFFFI